jgi:uncharacterized membrane protein
LIRAFHLLAVSALLALIILGLAWESWLAPLRPGGSMLVLKVLPLFAPLVGLLKGKRYTHQWASFLALLYVTEGSVRAISDIGPSRLYGGIEFLLAVALYSGCLGYARATAKIPPLAIKSAG